MQRNIIAFALVLSGGLASISGATDIYFVEDTQNPNLLKAISYAGA